MDVVMKTPKISVVLPTYNAGDYLLRAVNSILDQTLTDFELLIIDDGSTDNTAEIIAGFEDDRIVAITLPQNKGLIRALNHGLERAKGDYIARMNADDIALPTRLEK